MAINFPNAPTINQIAQVGDNFYIWNGSAWVGYTTSFTVNYNYNASSVVVQDDGVVSGATTTFNFGDNLSVSFNGGIATITSSSGLRVTEYENRTGLANTTINNVSELRFNNAAGFNVEGDPLIDGDGVAFIDLGSTFNPWYVDGQGTLKATGEEPIEFIAGPGIAITTKPIASVGIGTTFSKAITITATGDGGANVIISNTSPESPGVGDLWYDSINGRGFIYYDDGDSSQWVDFSPSGAASTSVVGGGGESYWTLTTAGIHTTSNVGIGTTNPRFPLEIGPVGASGTSLWINGDARIIGDFAFGESSVIIDGKNNIIKVGSGVSIDGNAGIITASSFSGSASGLTSIPASQLTGTLPPLDGSALIGVSGISSDVNINTTGIITAISFVKTNGTSDQFLKADGSVDSNTYATETYVGLATSGLATEGYVNTAVAGVTTFTGAATTITTTQISNWDTSYGWGDHSVVGYATEGTTNSLQSQINTLGTNLNIIGFYDADAGLVSSLTVVGETRGYVSIGNTLPNSGITTGDYFIVSTGGSNLGIASFITIGISSAYPGDWIVGTGNTEWNIISYSQQVVAPRATNADFANTLNGDSNVNTTGIITASSFVKSGGTSSQFLKADGSVDSSTYATETYVGLSTAGLASETYVDTQVGIATAGLLDQSGDGSNLTGIVTSITAGSGISIDQSTGNVTITSIGGGGGESYWTSTTAGIHTLSNVGIGTTNPTSALTVLGNTSLETLNVSGITTAANANITEVTLSRHIKSPNVIVAPTPIINKGSGSLSSLGTVSSPNGNHIEIDPSGRFVYVPNYDSNTITQYEIDQSRGTLTAIGSTATGTTPPTLAIDPTGRFLYVSNSVSDNVGQYTINQSTGALTSIGTIAAGDQPIGMKVDPTGRFLYVCNARSNTVQQYSINQTTGVLTSVRSIASGVWPYFLTIDPTGRFLYVTEDDSNRIEQFNIDQNTGHLTSSGTTSTGINPFYVTIDPSGRFLYLGTQDSDTLGQYTINQSTGALTLIGNISATDSVLGIAIDPTGKYAYVSVRNSSTIRQYEINQSTGALTFFGTISCSTDPGRSAVDPTGRFLYVTDYGSDVINQYTINNVSVGDFRATSIGIGTTNPTSALTVNGGIGATTLNVSGVSTFEGIVYPKQGIIISNSSGTSRIFNGETLYIDNQTTPSGTSIWGSIKFRTTSPGTPPTTSEALSIYAGGTYWNRLVEVHRSLLVDENATILGFTSTAQLNVSGIATASSFVKSGGTSSQFLKADGSVDSNTYLTTTGSASNLSSLTGASAGTYGNSSEVPQITVDGSGRITNISNINISGSGSWTYDGDSTYTFSNVGIGTTNPEKFPGFGVLTLDGSPVTAEETAGGNIILKSGGKDFLDMYSLSDTRTLLGFSELTLIDLFKPLMINSIGSDNKVVSIMDTKIGIGTTNPTSSLDVAGRISLPQNPIGVSYATTQSDPLYAISQRMGDNDYWQIYGEALSVDSSSAMVLEVLDNNDGGERIVFRNRQNFAGSTLDVATLMELKRGTSYLTGNVGIGTTNPLTTFHVYGDSVIYGPTTNSGLQIGSGQVDDGTISLTAYTTPIQTDPEFPEIDTHATLRFRHNNQALLDINAYNYFENGKYNPGAEFASDGFIGIGGSEGFFGGTPYSNQYYGAILATDSVTSLTHSIGVGTAFSQLNLDGDAGITLFVDKNYTFNIRKASQSSSYFTRTKISYDLFECWPNAAFYGSLSKGSGSFKIDHPLESKKDTHHLVHSFIEGPQADLIYRGKIKLVSGIATVNIDSASNMTEGTFEALCGDVQCFTTNEDGWTAIRGKVNGNILTIEAQDLSCEDTISWMVIGERKDPHMINADWTDENGKVIVEPIKSNEDVASNPPEITLSDIESKTTNFARMRNKI